MGKQINNETAKELALITNIIRQEELLSGSIFQTFDEIYKIAWAFIDKYGVDDVEWGVELEYEETVAEFATEYVKQKYLR